MFTALKKGSVSAVIFFALGGTLLLGGCTVDTSETEDWAEVEEENIASAEQAVYSGWTPWTSDGYSPITCDSGSLWSAFKCSGSYCDNVAAYCQPIGGSLGSSYWTPYFSEEGTNYKTCNSGYWVTGLSCTGSYCDNVSLQCSYISNKTAVSCYWTGEVSEENGGLLSFGSGYYARGAQCLGSNCDRMRFYVCKAQ